MAMTSKSEFQRSVPELFLALISLHEKIEAYGLDRKLSHLVMLRASQMNQCGFCVEMHTREAREDGESNERLDQVIVFQQSPLFSEAEKLALAWTEKLTEIKHDIETKPGRAEMLVHFREQQLAALTALVGLINTWNRIRISEH